MSLPIRRSFIIVLTLLLSQEALGAGKFDLSPYLGPLPLPGDFKVFALSNGGERRETVLEVAPWKKGWYVLTQLEETGEPTAWAEGFSIPGKQALLGDVLAGDLAVILKKPKKTMDVKATLGKIKSFRIKGTAFFQGDDIGPAVWVGFWQFRGIEAVETPFSSYPVSARIQTALGLGIQNRVTRHETGSVVEQTAWYAPGLGLVMTSGRRQVYTNGVLVEDGEHIDAWFESGRIAGVLVP